MRKHRGLFFAQRANTSRVAMNLRPDLRKTRKSLLKRNEMIIATASITDATGRPRYTFDYIGAVFGLSPANCRQIVWRAGIRRHKYASRGLGYGTRS